MMLGERRIQELDDRDVEAVEPEDRPIALVAVIVPRHRRGDDEITLVHDRALAVDGGVRAAALEHEPQRTLRMTMGWRDFAGQYQLHAGVEIRRDLGLPS